MTSHGRFCRPRAAGHAPAVLGPTPIAAYPPPQVSDNAVAEQCADAIAKLDFEKVSWLSDIPEPSRIQTEASFAMAHFTTGVPTEPTFACYSTLSPPS